MKRSYRLAACFAAALTLGMGACVDQESQPITGPQFSVAGLDTGPAEDFRVYTQNMWLGGETGPLFSLPLTDPSRFGEVVQAVNVFWAQVQASDIPARASEVVDEIGATRPDVVSLQEAVGYATGTLNLATFAFTPTAPGPDLLGSVMQEIAARGLPYQVGMMQPTTAVALPLGPPDASGVAPALGVQDRVVALVHQDAEIVGVGHGLYTAKIPLAPGIDFVRGWVRVTLQKNGRPYHFVSTHLEGQGDGPASFQRQIHNAQADELLGSILPGLDGEVVLMGDLNSDANGDPSKRSWTPTYGKLVDAGFIDVWASSPHRGTNDGITCCFEPGRTPDERIDFVLLRNPGPAEDDGNREQRGFYRADIVGDEMSDQTASGLWPSDHAGIIARISDPAMHD